MNNVTRLALSMACLAGCSGQTFHNAELSKYVGTWPFALSQINVHCSDGSAQTLGGSGQINVMVSSDSAENLSATISDTCPQAELTRQSTGYTLLTPVSCAQGMVTAMHLAIDTNELDTLLFSSSTQTMVNATTCTKAESGTATRSQ